MMKDDIGFELGNVMVATTQNKGHDPEFWAEQVTHKIVGISETAAPHIRQQAEAFRSPRLSSNIARNEELYPIRPRDYYKQASPARSRGNGEHYQGAVTMAITSAICTSFKQQLLVGTHNFTNGANSFKLALYTSSATLGAGTTVLCHHRSGFWDELPRWRICVNECNAFRYKRGWVCRF